jgi:hypothetical protein
MTFLTTLSTHVTGLEKPRRQGWSIYVSRTSHNRRCLQSVRHKPPQNHGLLSHDQCLLLFKFCVDLLGAHQLAKKFLLCIDRCSFYQFKLIDFVPKLLQNFVFHYSETHT